MQEIQDLLGQILTDTSKDYQRPIIGVAGAQGSGKSTLCRAFAAAHPEVAYFSLDDFYWFKQSRRELARTLHPLFITRGPPGTHDLDLLLGTMATMRGASAECKTELPRFDKAADERSEQWAHYQGKPQAFLIDGWCLGALPPELGPPLNAIEAIDSDGAWRKAQNQFLSTSYAYFFAQFDAIVYLRPPNWETVKAWRAEQEVETLGRALTREDHTRLSRFMMHYERLTRSMMAGHHWADWVADLDGARRVTALDPRHPLRPRPGGEDARLR